MALRPCLTLLLLLNYLLVVGAGLVERPARPIDRPFAYVHSRDCQLRHTLRLGCIDDCNGVQYTVKKNSERLPLQQLLASFKGLDAHCLPEGRVAVARPARRPADDRPAPTRGAGATGSRGERVFPPRRA
ncbi:MAG: hypothetical protein NVS3B25_24920 [Hymenobacter sp.]